MLDAVGVRPSRLPVHCHAAPCSLQRYAPPGRAPWRQAQHPQPNPNQVLDATGGTLDALYNNGAFALMYAATHRPRTPATQSSNPSLLPTGLQLTRPGLALPRGRGAVEDVPTAGLRELFEANFFGWHTLTRMPHRARTPE